MVARSMLFKLIKYALRRQNLQPYLKGKRLRFHVVGDIRQIYDEAEDDDAENSHMQ
jgi:hypothetical protein